MSLTLVFLKCIMPTLPHPTERAAARAAPGGAATDTAYEHTAVVEVKERLRASDPRSQVQGLQEYRLHHGAAAPHAEWHHHWSFSL